MTLPINWGTLSNPALIDEEGNSLTYGELQSKIKNISFKIKKGKLLFLIGDNNFSTIETYLACLECGATPLLLNSNISPSTLDRLIKLYNPYYIFISKNNSNNFKLNNIVHSFNSELIFELKSDIETELNPNLALLLATSGSTGSSKLVRISKNNLSSNTNSIINYLSINHRHRSITTLPFSYSYGLSIINSHLCAGASILLTNRSLFDSKFWQLMNSYDITSMGGVPYSYEILLKLRFERMNLPKLQNLTQAGGKMPEEQLLRLSEICKTKGIRFFTMYGQTEASPRMAFLSPEYLETKCGSIGRAIPGGHLWLEDEEGNVLESSGQVGELVYSGPNVALGYAENSDDLKKGDDWGGVLRTGDLAKVDGDGFFYIEGRKSRFLKIFGVRISLDSVEAWYASKHLVAAAHGQDDHLRVTLENVDQKWIDTEVRNLASMMQIHPSAITLKSVPTLPRLSSGKVDYQCLHKMH